METFLKCLFYHGPIKDESESESDNKVTSHHKGKSDLKETPSGFIIVINLVVLSVKFEGFAPKGVYNLYFEILCR